MNWNRKEWIMFFALVVLALALFATGQARAREFDIRIEPVPGYAPGIRQAPVYVGRTTPARRPDAGVIELFDPAPMNGCEWQGGGFRLESGPKAGACVGGR